ncbi:IclR family transcriptional regulator [Microtetraspora glauca]|uniref:IclR family transcriptional regulator n=1 Tax=Microtetraspora glauca TaxID=1996 RepID=A0ABV3GHK6_MICGL
MNLLETDASDTSAVAAKDREDSRRSVLGRMTEILDVFLEGPECLFLGDVTTRTGLPRSTAFRILSQLVELRWLEHDERGYRIGSRVYGMSARRADHSDLRNAAAVALNDLHAVTGAVVHLGVLEGLGMHYVDKIGGVAGRSIPSRVGSRYAALGTAAGRAMLAYLPTERVEAMIRLEIGEPSPSLLLRIHRELNETRRRHGLSVVHGTPRGTEINAVAAPILGPDGPAGAIAAIGRNLLVEPIAPVVLAAARRVGKELFPGWSPVTRRGHIGRATSGWTGRISPRGPHRAECEGEAHRVGERTTLRLGT